MIPKWTKVETSLLEIKPLGKGNLFGGYYGNQTTGFHKVWLELQLSCWVCR